MRYYVKQRRNGHDSRRAETLQRLLARHEAEVYVRRQLLRDHIAPPGEGRDAVVARDVGSAILEATARTVQNIENALRRLKTGADTTCLDCGSRIPAARLRALPFAERCRDCQQQHDPAPRYAPLFA